MSVTISFGLIAYIASIAIAAVVLWVFFTRVTKSPEPSGPAAIGRALGFLVLFEVLGTYLLRFLFDVPNLFLPPDALQTPYRIAVSILFCLVPMISGFLAARTTEEAHSMNYRILCALGLVPHAVITFLVLSGGALNHLVFWSFVPLAIAGGYLKSRQYRALRPTATSNEIVSLRINVLKAASVFILGFAAFALNNILASAFQLSKISLTTLYALETGIGLLIWGCVEAWPKRHQRSAPTATVWFLRITGGSVILVGIFLAFGNILGTFPTFPYAGTLLGGVAGGYLIWLAFDIQSRGHGRSPLDIRRFMDRSRR
jgi:hypothetical protein